MSVPDLVVSVLVVLGNTVNLLSAPEEKLLFSTVQQKLRNSPGVKVHVSHIANAFLGSGVFDQAEVLDSEIEELVKHERHGTVVAEEQVEERNVVIFFH